MAMASIQSIRRRAYEIMDGAVPDKYSHFVEVFVAVLVVANVIGIILESVLKFMKRWKRSSMLLTYLALLFFLLNLWSVSGLTEKNIYMMKTVQNGKVVRSICSAFTASLTL